MTTAVRQRKKADAAIKAAERADVALRAYKLRQQGYSWWEVAEDVQVSEAVAGRLINEQLEEAARLIDEGTKRTLLALEVDRLDQLQKGIWRQAISGDLRAVETVLKIISTRAKLLGLDDITINNITNNTVVIAGNGPDYVEALKAFATSTAPLEIEAS